jgi:molybdenum cofactor cytidylyltransferase
VTVAAVVLAAGRATRFGGVKQVARRAGTPLVRSVTEAALAGGVDEVVVVVGHAGEQVRAALPRDDRVRAVHNARYAEGQSTSLRAGLAALGPDVTVAVVLLADEPDVTGPAVAAVAAAGGATAARAVYDDGPGHPVALGRAVWPRVAATTGDRGARDLLRELDVTEVRLAGPRPRDVDVPGDLEPPADGAASTAGSGGEHLHDHAGDHGGGEDRGGAEVAADDLALPAAGTDHRRTDGDVDR